jgi:hypothetical protein
MAPAFDVRTVDPVNQIAVLDEGDILHITAFVDDDGNDCPALEAVGAIAEDGEDIWWIELTDEPERLN